MWIFDGETWTHEGGEASREQAPEMCAPLAGEFLPELQVLEVVPVVQQQTWIPSYASTFRTRYTPRPERDEMPSVTSIKQPPTAAN